MMALAQFGGAAFKRIIGTRRHRLDIATRAEGAPSSGEDDRGDRGIGRGFLHRGDQRIEHFAGKSVQPVGAVERENRDASGNGFDQIGHGCFPPRIITLCCSGE
jgi:hypothetical protein